MSGDFFLTEWFFLGMRWLCENVVNNSIFLTILISTVLLRLLTLPSDIKQRKSTAGMQEIQPKLQKIQERYKDDPRKLQMEQSKLMKENGVSMFSGCLPLLLTIPLLFCFIAAFRFWGYEQNVKMLIEMDQHISEANATGSEEIEVSETFLNSKFLWVYNIWQPDNGFSPVVTDAKTFYSNTVYSSTKRLIYFRDNPEAFEMLKNAGIFYDEVEGYSSLSDEDKAKAKEAAIAKYDELTNPLRNEYAGYNNGFFILPIIATALQFVYAWYIQRKQQKQNPAPAQQPAGLNGKFMLYLMPAMSFIFCLSATSAFAIYWTLSSFVMLVINIVLSYTMKKGEAEKPAS